MTGAPGSDAGAGLVDRTRAGPVVLGVVPAVVGGRNHLLDALAAEAAAGRPVAPGLADLAGTWTTRMALNRTTPAPAVHSSLVIDVCGPVRLVDRSGPGGHRVGALRPDGLPELLTEHLGAPTAAPTTLLADRALDPAAVAAGQLPSAVREQLSRAVTTLEAAYARRDETDRTHRPVVSLFGDGFSYLCLVADPRTDSLLLRHRDAAGAARLLVEVLHDLDGAAERHRLAPAARRVAER